MCKQYLHLTKNSLAFVFICCSVEGQGEVIRKSLSYPGLLASAGQLQFAHDDGKDFVWLMLISRT
jgi:hypothetical protein